MAKVRNLMEVEGRIKNLSFYSMEGCDQIIVRTKGGPCKYRVKNHPNFEKVRKNNAEWSGCTKFSGIIFNTMSSLFKLADYPVIGTLNGLCKMLQTKDTEGVHGARGLYLTRHGEMLEGFSPNKKRIFEQIVAVMLNYSVDREKLSAELTLPVINPDYQLNNARNLPYFRFVASLGLISDYYIPEGGRVYESYNRAYDFCCMEQKSEWFSTTAQIDAQHFSLVFHESIRADFTPNQSLVLGIGLEFGKENAAHQIEAVKHSGSARLLRVV